LGDVNPSCNLKAVSGQISQTHGYVTPPLYPNLSDMAMRDVKARQEPSKPWGMSALALALPNIMAIFKELLVKLGFQGYFQGPLC